MGVDYGFFIREQAIKNLLSAQRKMAAKGNAKGLIAVTKFILSISHQFDGEMLKISQGINIDGTYNVQNEMEKIESEQEKAKTDPVMTQMFGGAGDGKPGVLEEPGNGSKET